MDLIITFSPAILLVIAGFWFAYQFVAPPPPKKIVMTTGSKSGTYYKIAQQYREERQINQLFVRFSYVCQEKSIKVHNKDCPENTAPAHCCLCRLE
jgi:TRAP-type uncharacterized transport system substrate-binding protein